MPKTNANSTPWFTLNEKVWALCYHESELSREDPSNRLAASRAFVRMSQAFFDFWGRPINKRTFTGWLRDRTLHYNEFIREKLRAQYVEHVKLYGVHAVNPSLHEPFPPMYYGRSYPRYRKEPYSPASDSRFDGSSMISPHASYTQSCMLTPGDDSSSAYNVEVERGVDGGVLIRGDAGVSICGDGGSEFSSAESGSVFGEFVSGEGGSGFCEGESGLGGLPWYSLDGDLGSSTQGDVNVSDGSDLSFLSVGAEGWELVGCLCNSVS